MTPDTCEWDPNTDSPAVVGSTAHNELAEVVVGADGQWHLCFKCSQLKRFNRFTSRRPITNVCLADTIDALVNNDIERAYYILKVLHQILLGKGLNLSCKVHATEDDMAVDV